MLLDRLKLSTLCEGNQAQDITVVGLSHAKGTLLLLSKMIREVNRGMPYFTVADAVFFEFQMGK